MRHKIGSSSSPIFNREMNAVIDNFVVYTSETENGSRTTRLYPAGNTPTVALPFAPDDVPCLVGAHLLLGFGASYTQTAGFPWFTPGVNSMLHGWTSSFMATTSSNAPGFNFLFDLRRGSDLQITNHLFKYSDGIYDADGPADGILIPKGDNVKRYQLSDNNAVHDRDWET